MSDQVFVSIQHQRKRPQPAMAMSLLELLIVISIICVLSTMVLPAISSLNSRKFDSSINQITQILHRARQEARSKNTYTWALFYATSTPGDESLIVVLIGSKDGSDPIAWGNYPNTIPDSAIEVLAPPLKVPQLRLRDAGTFGTAQIVSLPSPAADSSKSLNTQIQVKMNVPGLGNITFQKAIRYLPSNGAGNNDETSKFIEFGLQPVHGRVANEKNVAVIRIDKASGLVQVFRP